MKYTNLATILLMISACIFAVRYHYKLKDYLLLIVPYFIIVIVLSFAAAAAMTIGDISLEDNLSSLCWNLFQVTRDSFMAAVGLMLLSIEGSGRSIKPWESSFSFWNETPKKWTMGLVTIIAIFTFLLTYFFPHQFHIIKDKNLAIFFSLYIYSILGAFSEEMLVRLFIIGLFVFWFRGKSYNWWLGILISSIYWGAMHLNSLTSSPIKFLHIFTIGLALGYLFKKYGFESSVFVHVTFNLVNISIALMI